MAPPILSNPDLAPTTPAQRTWSTWHIAALWIGMAVCIPTYSLAAGMIAQGMAWWQALLTVALGNLIVLIPMVLNGHPGTRYGIPFPVLMRASFGTRGANIPAIARALVACGWFGIQTWIGGAAIYQVLISLNIIDLHTEFFRLRGVAFPGPEGVDLSTLRGTGTILGITPWQWACFLFFWAINLHFIWRGMNSIKWLESWAAPFLIAAGLALLGWAIAKVGSPSRLFSQSSDFQPGQSFWTVFFPQLTAMVGFWATLSLNIPDFTRFARSQRAQVLGQTLGLPTTMTLFCFIGIAVTQAAVILYGRAIWDPVELIARIGSAPVIVISLIALTVATLSTNIAANVVSPANDFSNLSPRRISFRTGGLITAVIGIVMMPWYLYNNLGAYIFTWLIGYSALLGPIAGIMLCDYYLIRRTRLNVAALYDPAGEYAYGRSGFNARAIVALVLAVLPNLPGFINAATKSQVFSPFFDQIYQYAWFAGVLIAGVLYWLLMKGRPAPFAAE